jgi:hypothetical protein
MYVKVIVSISIFILMLIGAWLLNEQTKREYYYTDNSPEDGIIQIQTTGDANQGTFTNFPAFGSREYIRIVR